MNYIAEGRVEKDKWEYLDHNSLLIEKKNERANNPDPPGNFQKIKKARTKITAMATSIQITLTSKAVNRSHSAIFSFTLSVSRFSLSAFS